MGWLKSSKELEGTQGLAQGHFMRTDGLLLLSPIFYILYHLFQQKIQCEGNIIVLGLLSSHAGGTVVLSVITLVQNEISATFGGFAMKSGTDIDNLQRLNPIDLCDPLTVPLAPP